MNDTLEPSSPKLTNAFGIYVHIPFCVHKCSYCDFYSFTKYDSDDFERLVSALEQEVARSAGWLAGQGRELPEATSVFFGGGTPSLLPPALLARVCAALRKEFRFARDAEVTMEANPETVSREFLTELRSCTPINRISLGAQSFRAEDLKSLERLGSRESILTAASFLASVGFSNFNLDLIFAIPGQGRSNLVSDIDEAACLGPKHISFYNLSLKPGHPLYRSLPTADAAAEAFETGIARLNEHGYAQYEISNFSRPGFESRHNLLYWNGGDFLGLGPSAASRFFWGGQFHHRKALADFRRYLTETEFPSSPFEASSRPQTVLEATFLELRKREGVDCPEFSRRYGYDLTQARKFPLFLREGLLSHRDGRLSLTHRGRMLADSVTEALVDWDRIPERV